MTARRWLAVPLAAVALAPAQAADYMSVEQAQHLMFPEAGGFEPLTTTVDAARSQRLDHIARVQSTVEPRIWAVRGGGNIIGYFAMHHVIGKQEYISYAVGLDAGGRVKDVEILAYRESHGYEIRNPAWRAQFAGKNAAAPIQLEQDIVNISGATLSARHVTDGVRRIVALVDMISRGN